MFFDKLPNDQAKRAIAAGRSVWEYKTKNVHVGPIFGPAYDDRGALNRAKKANLYAETVEQAQKCAKALGTEIVEVVFVGER